MHFLSIFLTLLPLAYASPIPSRCLELQQLDETLTALADIDRTNMTEHGVKKLGELMVAQPAIRKELEKCFTDNRRRDLDDALSGLGQSIQGLLGQESGDIAVDIDQTNFIGNYGDYNRQDGGEDQVDNN
ncbi:uncharacterized protein ASPGLDRAFT_41034 [Aspergillus glaucus CBS 516.65]|uniref:Uncharacterized protein n=1 Tax=Aspergillus glaucus CBS 516.65 TaxID=1160497 RepID=A0A1L9VYZ1_ASPGL|nr:hypothetical protein ASPGLDRAFT_41034 [Aspergillus glaucus CBS 516.65]OJJ89099.1 hypothetical protein ASPGLDRAFT_41034 [Aspergillus glaucus CBS 516.65]